MNLGENNGSLLAVKNLCKYFGGLAAVDNLDFSVTEGKITGLIGPNGAGKTTVLNMIGGTLLPSSGKIIFNKEDITSIPPYKKARVGIGRVFQRNLLFGNFSVIENILAAFHLHSNRKTLEIFYKGKDARQRDQSDHNDALDLLSFFKLTPYADMQSKSLPHGCQRALCLAVVAAMKPKLMLLDEPLSGMNAEETDDLMEMINAFKAEMGITILIIEHNMKAIMNLCENIVVLNYGKKIASGTPKEIAQNPEVIKAYLGGSI